MFFYRKRDLVGFDIGSSSIKLVHLKAVGGGYHLLRMGIMPLPSEVIVDGAMMNAGVVGDVLRSLLVSHKIKRNTDACTSVSGHSVIIKKILLPKMTRVDLDETIRYDAEQYIPFDVNEVNLDFRIIGPAPDDPEQMEVLLVAVKTDMIDDYTAILSEVGLNPIIVDIDAFCIQNMFEVNYPDELDKAVALINIGASITTINVVHEGNSAFIRDISAGGNLYTGEIQKRLNISFEEAEELKLGGTIEADQSAGNVEHQEVNGIISAISDNLSDEIQRSLDFYASATSGEEISHIYLTGGTAKIYGLTEIIERKTGIPTSLLNPLRKITFNEKEFDAGYLDNISPILGVAIGLALRRIGDRNQ